MNPFNPDTWKQQWAAFWSAPLVIGPLIAIAGFAGGSGGDCLQAQVSGLKEQIAAMEQRLKLAADASTASERAKDELDKQFQAYRAEVAAKGNNASPAKVEAAFEQLKREDAIIAAGLKAAQQALEFGQYGALKKLDYETLKKLERVGKIPGLTLNSIPDHMKKRD